MAKRKLKEEELHALRHLATRVGVGAPTYDIYDAATGKFLLGRGLVRVMEGRVFARHEITEEGLLEIARSGRVTLYDPAYLVNKYREIYEAVKPPLSDRANRVVGLYEYIDPSFPHRNLENILFLRHEEYLWKAGSRGEADFLLAIVRDWLANTIEGHATIAVSCEKRVFAEVERLEKKTLT